MTPYDLALREVAFLTTLAARPKGAARRRLVRRMRYGVLRGLKAQMDAVLSVLSHRTKALEDEALIALIDEVLQPAVLRPTIRQIASQSWLMGARSANETFDISPGIGSTSPDFDRYIEQVLAPSIDGIHRFTRERILHIVATGMAAGLATTAIMDEVRSQRDAGVFSEARANRIAGYEVQHAFIDGRRKAGAAGAVRVEKVQQKRWVTTGAKTVDEKCEGNERQGWIPDDQPFASGHDAPLAHANCKCDLDTRWVNPKS